MKNHPVMNTYESERTALFEWLNLKTKEYDEAERKEIEERGLQRDSEAGYQYQLCIQEYNRKLVALKEKHNKE